MSDLSESIGGTMSNVDTRIAYGVGCTWWDSIHKVATKSGGLPCCPSCGGLLFEVPSDVEWWSGYEEETGNPQCDEVVVS